MSGYLDIGIISSALRANQKALSVTSNNVANASTQGYRRQDVSLEAVAPAIGGLTNNSGSTPLVGGGVNIASIQRAQTTFLDRQIETMDQQYSYNSSMNQTLSQVEAALGEPGDNGISSALTNFWNSWDDLANAPESAAAKSAVVSAGQTLADKIQTLDGNIAKVQSQTDDSIVAEASQINDTAQKIAKLNVQITNASAQGTTANDLMDERSTLVEKLAGITGIQVNGNDQSGLIISIGGKTLVQGAEATEIETTQDSSGKTQLTWKDEGTTVSITGGALKANIDARDKQLQGYADTLNEFAQQLVTQVNTVYSSGKDSTGASAGNFFVAGADASNIAVESTLIAKPSGVVTSADGTTGDNSIARSISAISETAYSALGNATLANTYSGLTAQIGSDVKQTSTLMNLNKLTLQQLNSQRDSITGVSLDEEMMNMTKFQQGYNAAARVFTVIDDMTNTIIQKLGGG